MSMKKRLPYLLGFTAVLVIELCIGIFVRDDFVRPYVGDVLVTVLLCCLGRMVFPDRFPWLPAAVFLFAVAVECVQLFSIPALEDTVWGVLLGSTFDGADILCYGIGCASFVILDLLYRSCQRIPLTDAS